MPIIVKLCKDRINSSLRRYTNFKMLRTTTYWIINILLVFVRRQMRRVQRLRHRLSIQCHGRGLYGCDMRQLTRYIYRKACRPFSCLPKIVQRWQSVLLVGLLMVAGCLLMFQLYVHITLNPPNAIRNIQKDLPHFELPSDILLKKVIKNDTNIKKNRGEGKEMLEARIFEREGQGVPEAEMNHPVAPDLEKAELINLVPVVKPNASWCQYQNLRKALTEIVDGKHVFVLVIPDADHVDLAKNILQTIERWTRVRNLLFVCRDVMLCEMTKQHGIPCYIDESSPGSSAPVFKTIVDVLEMDYTPIYMDFETSLTKPLPFLPTGNIDMVIPYGNTPKAHSFFISLNTAGSLRFHKTAIQDAERNVNKSFSAVFHSVLGAILKKKPTFKLTRMPKCTKSPVDPNCCVTRHPAFSSVADRTLWLKDKQLWFYDMDGYYTDPNALYISYENNYDMGNRTIEYAVHALKNALAYGKILNRIVILPKFFCPICEQGKCKQHNCLLSHFMDMSRFDKVFGNWYREHSFRGHPLVPVKTRKSVSQVFHVKNALHKGMLQAGGVQVPSSVVVNKIIMTNSIIEGPYADEVLDLFEEYATKHKILVFADLYGVFSGFTSAKDSLEFEMKLKKGIVLLSKT